MDDFPNYTNQTRSFDYVDENGSDIEFNNLNPSHVGRAREMPN